MSTSVLLAMTKPCLFLFAPFHTLNGCEFVMNHKKITVDNAQSFKVLPTALFTDSTQFFFLRQVVVEVNVCM